MHTRTRTAVAAVAIAALSVVGIDTLTYAGTGDSLILGKVNESGRTTHVTSSGSGPALSLHASDKGPALAVDSDAKVTGLNADRVDGLEATALQSTTRVYTVSSGDHHGSAGFKLPELPKGNYLATYSVFLNLGEDAQLPVDGECGLIGDQTTFVAFTYADTESRSHIALSGSGVITEGTGSWWLYCDLGGQTPFTIIDQAPIQVTLTRIDHTVNGSLDEGRTGASDGATR